MPTLCIIPASALQRFVSQRFGFDPIFFSGFLDHALHVVDLFVAVTDLLAEFDDNIGDLGELYEYMLSKMSTAGTNGQFRTPQHIRKMMVVMIDPKPGELVCEETVA